MLTTIWTYDTKVEWFHVQDQMECVSTPREQQNVTLFFYQVMTITLITATHRITDIISNYIWKGILHARNNTAKTFR